MSDIDRSEVAAAIGAALVIFAPAIHKLGIDQYVNFDLTNTSILIGAVILLGAYLLHRSSKAA